MPQQNHLKLETVFDGGSVIHTTYLSDNKSMQRRTPVLTRWTETKHLGSGAFGVVVLQENEMGELRAVKKLLKGMGNIDYARELNVLSKVANVCFSRSLFMRRLMGTESSSKTSSCTARDGTRMPSAFTSRWNT